MADHQEWEGDTVPPDPVQNTAGTPPCSTLGNPANPAEMTPSFPSPPCPPNNAALSLYRQVLQHRTPHPHPPPSMLQRKPDQRVKWLKAPGADPLICQALTDGDKGDPGSSCKAPTTAEGQPPVLGGGRTGDRGGRELSPSLHQGEQFLGSDRTRVSAIVTATRP